MSAIMDSFRVAWIDMCFLRRNIVSVLVTCLVSPLLYLLAFGYGLGRGMTVEGFEYISFMIPGVIALSTLTSCFSTVASKVMVQRVYYQSFDELFLCSMKPMAIIMGKTYAGTVRGLLSAFVLYALGMLLSNDMHISLMAAFVIVLSSVVYSLMGVFCGLLSNSNLTMNMITSLLIVPMTFLCGTLFSLDALPQAVQAVIEVLPLTHTTACMRAAALGTPFPWLSLLVILIYGVIFAAVCRHLIIKGRV